MGKSRAKRTREKIVREGKRNPEQSRSEYVYADLRTRVTKTKKDQLYRIKHKNQYSKKRDNDSFCFI
ncbi:hypothetical protein SAMN05216565_12420 [Litchfieldia salsa]|uniref:Uncharacterized protein n=1 Tax=Litchfieldia salsa TaxID=930152 RepID=A0A1H0X237_9BACI|nr:hypothetical protein [Litchfieldia salsa]SDP97003.1 hypothetical protein SAMN05216565_12420 [Litchfieldia salsa]